MVFIKKNILDMDLFCILLFLEIKKTCPKGCRIRKREEFLDHKKA